MINESYQDADKRMKKCLLSLEEDFSRQRAGRASPNLLDGVMVDYYGTTTPLTQVASVVVEGAMMIVVKPWEKKLIPVIEKAIMISGLGLNPSSTGDMVRVPLPPLSEERRKEFIKKVKADAEAARVSIRNIRRDANNKMKEAQKDKLISEDEFRQSEDKMQKLTDSYIKQIDAKLVAKESDLMEM